MCYRQRGEERERGTGPVVELGTGGRNLRFFFFEIEGGGRDISRSNDEEVGNGEERGV